MPVKKTPNHDGPASIPVGPTAPEVMTTSPRSEKPGLVTAIIAMTLVNGILNVLWGLGMSLGMLAGLVTICLIPFTILPAILGVFEIVYAARLLAMPPQQLQPSQTIAILEICCILAGNVVSLIVGILVLVFYGDERVKAYFARMNQSA